MPNPGEFAALEDVGVFVALGPQARQDLAQRAIAALGGDWHAAPPTVASAVEEPGIDALPLLHAGTGFLFHLIPGGVFEMGLTDEDLAAFRREVTGSEATDKILARYQKILRPVRTVTVQPFLVTPESIYFEDVRRLSNNRYRGDTFERVQALDLAHSAGFRLPSEAEREWLARDGGRQSFTLDGVACTRARSRPRSRFGIKGLEYEEWLEDDWHSTYDGAPLTSEPWQNGHERGVYRGGLLLAAVQSDSEFLFGLAALRFPGPARPPTQAAENEPSLEGIEETETPDAVARFALAFPVAP